jgi:hypothetical protein
MIIYKKDALTPKRVTSLPENLRVSVASPTNKKFCSYKKSKKYQKKCLTMTLDSAGKSQTENSTIIGRLVEGIIRPYISFVAGPLLPMISRQ